MDRKDFFKKVCVSGICGCTGLAFLLNSKIYADDGENNAKEEDWRIGFIQKRFAKLVSTCSDKLDKNTNREIFEQMGRECSNEHKENTLKYIDNIEGFIKELETEWAEKVDYDKVKSEIVIYGKKKDRCFCPFVDNSLMTGDFCNCSIGWFRQTFEFISGKEADVELVSSVLQGDERCTFTVKI